MRTLSLSGANKKSRQEYWHSFIEGNKNTIYSKTCVKWPLSKRPKIHLHDQLSLNAGQSIAESSNRSILQYFGPSLSYHMAFKTFVLSFFEWLFYTSGNFTQLLLYHINLYPASIFLSAFYICYIYSSALQTSFFSWKQTIWTLVRLLWDHIVCNTWPDCSGTIFFAI